MLNKQNLFTFFVFLVFCIQAGGAELSSKSILEKYDSGKAEYKEADRLLNEARFTTADKRKAAARVRDLRTIAEMHPDYPYKGMVQYFIGINLRILEDYGGAVDAFSKALEHNPDLADRTPIEAFMSESAQTWRKAWIPKILWVVFSLFVLTGAAFLILYPPDKKVLLRGLKLAVILVLLWTVVFFIAAGVSRAIRPDTLSGYPKPVLVQSGPGEIGAGLLWNYFLFGLLSAAVCAFACLSLHWVSSDRKRLILSLVSSLLISTLCMTIFFVEHLYVESAYTGSAAGGRFNVLTKEIVFKREIPEAMFELYDEDFRKRLREELKDGADE